MVDFAETAEVDGHIHMSVLLIHERKQVYEQSYCAESRLLQPCQRQEMCVA